MYAKTVIIGRLTRDPEVKSFGESSVTRFTVAVDEGYGEKKKTHFYNCSAWNGLGSNVQKFTKKGSLVSVEGMMISSKKDTTTYWELRADVVKFLSSGNEAQAGGQQRGRQNQNQYQSRNQYAGNQQPAYSKQGAHSQSMPYEDDFFAGTEISSDGLPF